jgi:hypothetical protein
MLVEEMTQRHEQFLRMLDTTGVERPVNVVNDHSPDGFPAMGLLQQVVCQGGGRDFRNMLVLADGGDFVFVQSAKAMQSSKETIASSNLCAGRPHAHRSKPRQILYRTDADQRVSCADTIGTVVGLIGHEAAGRDEETIRVA